METDRASMIFLLAVGQARMKKTQKNIEGGTIDGVEHMPGDDQTEERHGRIPSQPVDETAEQTRHQTLHDAAAIQGRQRQEIEQEEQDVQVERHREKKR